MTGGQLRLTHESNVYRQVNLSGKSWARLTFAYTTSGNLGGDDATWVEVASSAAGPWTTAFTFIDDQTGSRTQLHPAGLVLRHDNDPFPDRGHTGFYGDFSVLRQRRRHVPVRGRNSDERRSRPAEFRDHRGRVQPLAAAIATLTFSVTVDNPFPAGQTEIRNVATAIANEIPLPISDDALNQVVDPSAASATVGDRVWLDRDGDGVLDLGEAGIAGGGADAQGRVGHAAPGHHHGQPRALLVRRSAARQRLLRGRHRRGPSGPRPVLRFEDRQPDEQLQPRGRADVPQCRCRLRGHRGHRDDRRPGLERRRRRHHSRPGRAGDRRRRR